MSLQPKHNQVELRSLEHGPVAGITLLPERPHHWHCTATRINKFRADTPVELQPVNKTLRRYACEPEPVAGTVPLLQ